MTSDNGEEGGTGMEVEEVQVTCRFVTNLPQKYVLPETTLSVPADATRYRLSQIINHLICLEKAEAFDFLIGGQLVRDSLKNHLLSRQISTEQVLEIEYVKLVLPPQQKTQITQEDWIASVCAREGLILSGSYDGQLKAFNEEGDLLFNFSAHRGVAKCVAMVKGTEHENMILTGGKDRIGKLWKVELNEAKQIATYAEHNGSIECITSNPTGTHAATCGWDSKIKIWKTGQEVLSEYQQQVQQEQTGGSKKKRKTGQTTKTAIQSAQKVNSLAQFEGHTQCVSYIRWGSSTKLYSCSWDHSVRQWDAEKGIAVNTINTNKPIFSLDYQIQTHNIIAFVGGDQLLRIWDSRVQPGEGLGLRSLKSHKEWATCIKWSPVSSNHLVTGSHDKTLKIWDIRADVPLTTIQQHDDKILCVDWYSAASMVSGGADKQVNVYNMQQQVV
eukprot:TRINITY_DN14094_c0_g2_i1.p1 TRINITY_DN14094_c0_g2~~TRINITY_DN14094_c0_g2_i1.p1  ORF type:complete len:461 (-),score=38.53 TRINITY_DN14094_c0_g2_i1:376-1704(-)